MDGLGLSASVLSRVRCPRAGRLHPSHRGPNRGLSPRPAHRRAELPELCPPRLQTGRPDPPPGPPAHLRKESWTPSHRPQSRQGRQVPRAARGELGAPPRQDWGLSTPREHADWTRRPRPPPGAYLRTDVSRPAHTSPRMRTRGRGLAAAGRYQSVSRGGLGLYHQLAAGGRGGGGPDALSAPPLPPLQ